MSTNNPPSKIVKGAVASGSESVVHKADSATNKKSENIFIDWNIQPGFTSGLFGYVDALGQNGISGWAVDVARPFEPLNITIYINNIAIASGITDAYRPDISKIIQVPANCGFRIEWDKNKVINAINSLKENQLCPIAICPDDETRSFATVITPSVAEVQKWLSTEPVDGYLDHVDSNLIVTGWAINPSKDHPARVEILLDGVVVAETEANSPRPDFIASKPDLAMSGFKIPIPRKALTRLVSQLEARVDNYSLPGTPIKIDLSEQITIAISITNNSELRIELSGWHGDVLEGELQIDGRKATILPLNIVRSTKKLEGCWTLPEYLVDGQPHLYAFVIREDDTVVRSDASVLSYPLYSFYIDKATLNMISGRVFRQDRATPLRIGLSSLGQMVVTPVTTNITRLDVPHSYTSYTDTGFEFILPPLPNVNEFELIDVETGITLANVAVATPYESLTALANSLATSQPVADAALLRAVLPQMIMQSSEESVFSVQVLPRVKHTLHPDWVTVVIPVYGGAVETIECIESVLVARNKTPTRIVIINDCTPDPLIEDYLAALEMRDCEDLMIIHRTTNGGFSQAVNIGMIIADNSDVILLNADTVVQSRWVDRLVDAANIGTRIGTVTPLSNNAEICTVPYMCKSLPVTTSTLATEIDHAAASMNAGKIIDIPVAVGFCMYIRRECIDEIGMFDAATWGRGYGEEVDFCLKASARGWRNVMTGDTFIVHRGNISFGDEKLERIKESAKKITERYPFYDQLIQRFLMADPGAPIRRAINIELINNALPQKRILHITHGFGGGTEQYIKDMAILNIESGYTPMVLRFMDTGTAELDIDLTDTRLAGFFSDAHKENYTPYNIEAIKESIVKLGFERLHIHAPFGIPFELLDWLSITYPINVTIHDYAWICPRVTLTNTGGNYCGEPRVEQCRNCIDFYNPHSGLKHFVKEAVGDIAQYRSMLGSIVARAETVFAGSKDVVQRMKRHGMQGNYTTTRHPETKGSIFSKSRNLVNKSIDDGVVRVALLGGISDIKGFHVFIECAENAFKKKLPLQFIVFGYTMNDELCSALSNIEVLGKYDDEELDELVQKYRPHVSFFPNQWPETFSYTLSHSFRLGIWPVVSDIGAPAERVKNLKFGNVFDLNLGAEDICRFLIDQALTQQAIK